jgi:putative FmdB family regulatory protein
MPIYEYQCTQCSHQFDALQKISDDPLTLCPQCGQSSLQKLVSAAGFQLKGNGWYATDFKSKPKAQESSNSEPAAAQPKATTDSVKTSEVHE